MAESSPLPLKIAIVGTGKVARQNYIPFLARQPHVALGYYNRTPEKAKQGRLYFFGKIWMARNFGE